MSRPSHVLGVPASIFAMGIWVGATAMEASMMGIIRAVPTFGPPLDSLQILFMRVLFGVAFFLPFILHRRRAIHTTRLPLHTLRAFLQVTSTALWFAAIPVLPLAEIAALSFLAPLFATLGAMLLLKERVGWRRGLAMAAGFSGVLVLLRPGFAAINADYLYVIGSSSLWAMALLTIKALARTESPAVMTAWASLLMLPFAALPGVLVWQWPSWEQWALMAVVGCVGSCAHMGLGLAFRLADASTVLPMDFCRMLWTALIGYLFFAQTPTVFTFIGGFMIFAAATYVTLREARLVRLRSAQAAESD